MDFDGSDSDDSDGQSFLLHNAAEVGDLVLLTTLLEPQPIVPTEPSLGDLVQVAPVLRPPALPDLNQRDDNNCTPLHLALLNGHLEVASALLEAGASVHKGCEGSPPLHIAVCAGSQPGQQEFAAAAAALLLRHGAVPYDRDDHGRTPLHWAAFLGLAPVIETLVTAAEALRAEAAAAAAASAAAAATEGGSREEEEPLPPLWMMQDKQGNTALHLAARYRQPGAAAALLQAAAAAANDDKAAAAGGEGCGAAVALAHPARALSKVKNKAGQVALHCAALGGCAESAAALRAAAPSTVNSKDKQGLTPAEAAARRGHLALAAQLGAGAQGGAVPAAPAAPQAERTLLVAPPQCLRHLTCPDPILRGGPEPPPENVNRLRVLTTPGSGVLRADEFQATLSWDEAPQAAALGDILRIHDWAYVRRIQALCERIPDSPSTVGHLDGDTAVSHGTFAAALAAAGAVCSAVDRLMAGEARNAFCAVRPPGHHAGPQGVVTCANDPHGSHGFCLFNNVAIGAAYAMNVYRHAGIKRVAILDFDVHHGNGTEACVTGTIPSVRAFKFSTPFSEGLQSFPVYRPWLGADDRENIFFASVQGYGPKMAGIDAFVYPGSGATFDTRATAAADAAAAAPPTAAEDGAAAGGATPAAADADGVKQEEGKGAVGMEVDGEGPAGEAGEAGPAGAAEEDPEHEFVYHGGEAPPTEGPRIIDVGIPGPGSKVGLWRRSWRNKILPALANFRPDIIFVSAGFDAHKKDEINFHYIGVTERDYEWLTDQLVQVANRCCAGRLVSVLEGGYRIQGGLVSAFARSVAAHVRALAEPHSQAWDPLDAKWEREYEKKQRAEAEAKRAAAAAAAAAERAAAAAAAAAAATLVSPPPAPAAAAGGAPSEAQGAGGAPAPDQPEGPAADAPAAAGAEGEAPPPAAAATAAEPEPKRRRRGATVDYVALNKQLEAEQAAVAGGKGAAP